MQRGTLWLLALLTLPLAARAEGRHQVRTPSGGTVEYTDRGTGPAIVAVASLGRGAADFDDLAACLDAAGFRVIAPEPRGLGGSTGPADPSLHDYAADLAAVVEATGTAPVVVLGHAYGNTVARTLATDRPDLVRGVVLVAASGRAPLTLDIRDAIAKSSDLSMPDAQRLPFLGRGYFASGNDAAPWLGGWHADVQAAQLRAYIQSQPGDYVPAGGRVPILDLQGAEDVIIPRQYSRDLQRELGEGRVTVVVLPHAGHALLPEQPVAAASAISDWMHATFGGR